MEILYISAGEKSSDKPEEVRARFKWFSPYLSHRGESAALDAQLSVIIECCSACAVDREGRLDHRDWKTVAVARSVRPPAEGTALTTAGGQVAALK